jgi:hypothetical protein
MSSFERIIITKAILSGGGFAVTCKGGMAIYIPPFAGPVEEEHTSKEFLAQVVPNARDDTPLKATFVDWHGRISIDPTPGDDFFPAPQIDRGLPTPVNGLPCLPSDAAKEDLEAHLKSILKARGRPMRSSKVISAVLDSVDEELQLLANRTNEGACITRQLHAMHSRGEVVLAEVFKKEDQERVSLYLWGADNDAFDAF